MISETAVRIYPVILCGGSGTRLWPASRASRPKQFIPLIGPRSLFQDTVLRLRGLPDAAPPLIVAGEQHLELIRAQLAEVGVEALVLVEPEGRDSAPAVAAAAAWIARQDPLGVAVLVASDHHVPDAGAFRDAAILAAGAAQAGVIVTFGVRPTAPATAYGYIEPGEALAGFSGVQALTRFIEKPDEATARGYVAAGYLWNSGNFVFQAAAMLDQLKRYAPEVLEAADAAVVEARPAAGVLRLGPSFRGAPKISVDYAVMEKTDRAAVAPVAFAWSDLGVWDAVLAAAPQDADGNAASGDVRLLDAQGVLARSEGPLVVVLGARDLAVIATPDAVLVCGLAASQQVKTVTDQLRRDGRPEADHWPKGPGVAATGFRSWLFTSALPLWWSLGADHVRGGFHEALDLERRPVEAPRRARVQARQAHVFAAAGQLGWTGPWRTAVEHGLDYLFAHYRRPDGLFRTLVDADGAPADETVMLYDQAFALLAMASAAKALPERAGALAKEARTVVETLRRTRSAGRGFTEPTGVTPFQANPHMHLFEAALAWEQTGGLDGAAALADELAELCLSRFIDAGTGALREHFDSDWRPAPGPPGRLVEPGHQFEWAWLLERWGAARGRADARAAARRLFAVGCEGVDAARGVAVNALLDDFSVQDPGARLWPQTERVKAARLLAAADPGQPGYAAAATAAAAGLGRYLDGVPPGLWRDRLGADGRFVSEPAPASSLYHIVGAIVEMGEA